VEGLMPIPFFKLLKYLMVLHLIQV
jgi:hypothetical protein